MSGWLATVNVGVQAQDAATWAPRPNRARRLRVPSDLPTTLPEATATTFLILLNRLEIYLPLRVRMSYELDGLSGSC